MVVPKDTITNIVHITVDYITHLVPTLFRISPPRTEMREPVPPIMNDKIIQLTSRVDEALVIPCVAYASPRPEYRWSVRRNGLDEPLLPALAAAGDASSAKLLLMMGGQHHSGSGGMSALGGGGRVSVRDGTLIIGGVRQADAGLYYCTATNAEGTERLEVQLDVVAPLTVHVQPVHQTIDLGKPTELVSKRVFR